MHGLVALKLGDPTAKYANRLNLNPFSHMELWGSFLAPLIMLVLTNFSFAFGWAKPVPYNPYNLKNQKWGPALVALGGPISNIILALVATIIAKSIPIMTSVKLDILGRFYEILSGSGDFLDRWHLLAQSISGSLFNIAFVLMLMIILWNVLLATFNLIPFPPLDGSKLLFTIFPIKTETMIMFEQYGLLFLIVFFFIFSRPFYYLLSILLNTFFNLTI
jgi:Zn-dependent protease